MASRQVFLFINIFLAYYVKLNFFKKEFLQCLTNTKIVFLSANYTYICQSLD